MFSEASVSHSVHGGGGGGGGEGRASASRGWGWADRTGSETEGGGCPTPPVVTSTGGHCSGRYASYWNAFLFLSNFSLVTVAKTLLLNISITGWEWLIQSHSSARFCFELSGNSN